MSKVCASSHEYPHVEKNSRIFVNVKGTVTQPTVTGKESTLWQKEKPQGKKKKPHSKKKKTHSKKNKLAAKRITSRQKKKE